MAVTEQRLPAVRRHAHPGLWAWHPGSDGQAGTPVPRWDWSMAVPERLLPAVRRRLEILIIVVFFKLDSEWRRWCVVNQAYVPSQRACRDIIPVQNMRSVGGEWRLTGKGLDDRYIMLLDHHLLSETTTPIYSPAEGWRAISRNTEMGAPACERLRLSILLVASSK
jgi:hypothetical protein